MTGIEAALWGLLGSAVAEALNLSASMRPVGPRRRWRWPWGAGSDRPMVMVAVGLRLFVGSGLAAALGASDQLPTPFAAFLAGLAAPLIVARIFQTVPLTDPEDGAIPPKEIANLLPGPLGFDGNGNAVTKAPNSDALSEGVSDAAS